MECGMTKLFSTNLQRRSDRIYTGIEEDICVGDIHVHSTTHVPNGPKWWRDGGDQSVCVWGTRVTITWDKTTEGSTNEGRRYK